MQLQNQQITINIVKAQRRYEDYKERASRILGGLQITLGVLSIAFNICAIVFDIWPSFVSHGLWLPVFMFIAGGFGIAASFRKTPCTVIATMVMSILAASFMFVYIPMVILQLIFAEYDDPTWDCEDRDSYYEDCGCYETTDPDTGNLTEICVNCVPWEETCTHSGQYVVSALMLVVGVTELIIAIVAAVLCCRVVGCCSNTSTSQAGPQSVFVNTAQGPQAISLPKGYQVAPQAPTEIEAGHPKQYEAQDIENQQNHPPPYTQNI